MLSHLITKIARARDQLSSQGACLACKKPRVQSLTPHKPDVWWWYTLVPSVFRKLETIGLELQGHPSYGYIVSWRPVWMYKTLLTKNKQTNKQTNKRQLVHCIHHVTDYSAVQICTFWGSPGKSRERADIIF